MQAYDAALEQGSYGLILICSAAVSFLRLLKHMMAWASVFGMGVTLGVLVAGCLAMQSDLPCAEQADIGSTWGKLGQRFTKARLTGEWTMAHVTKIADLATFLMGEGAYLVTAPMLFSQLFRWSSFARFFWRPGRRSGRAY